MTRRLTNHWVSLHQNGVPAGFKPLLVMDVWEHAYMRDYRAIEKGLYVDRRAKTDRAHGDQAGHGCLSTRFARGQ